MREREHAMVRSGSNTRRRRRILWVALGAALLAACCWPTAEVQWRLWRLRAEGRPVRVQDALAAREPCPDNAAPLYVQALQILQSGGSSIVADANLQDPAAVRRLAMAMGPTLPLLAEAARRSGCQFELEREERGLPFPSWVAPHVGPLAEGLTACALEAAQRGDGAEGAEMLRLGFALSRHCAEGLLAGSTDMAWNMDRDLMIAAAALLLGTTVPEAQARALAEELLSADYLRACAEALDSAQRECVEAHLWIQRHPAGVVAAFQDCSPAYGSAIGGLVDDCAQSLGAAGLAVYLASPAYDYELCHLLRTLEAARKLSAQPWRTSSSQLARLAAAGCASAWGMTRGMETTIADEPRRRDEAIARRGLLLAALAVHRFRADHGRLPRSLSECDPGGLPIPDDVFSARPFRYTLKGLGFTLHSIGANLRDDGGKWVAGGPADDLSWPPPKPPASRPPAPPPPGGEGGE